MERILGIIYKLFPFLIGLVACVSIYENGLKGDNWESVLRVDAKGYYGYLNAVFVHQDISFQWFEEYEIENSKRPEFNYWYIADIEGSRTNKYFAGTAVLITPF
ncbi:MAG: hypothetical protein HRT74_14425, partial [Flavobacteriales bacterium]|nr:hypothetical protein [Flavobacteriales bacterium]